MTSNASKSRPLVLDGPSALALYRSRDALRDLIAHQKATVPLVYSKDIDDDFRLMDDDVAATLSEASIFGYSDEFDTPELGGRDDSATNVKEPLPLEPCRVQQLRACAAHSSEFKQVPFETLGIDRPTADNPLFVLVASRDEVRRVTNVHERAQSTAIPARSLLRLGENAYVPTPEFTFLLMAHYLTLPALTLLGMELCAHYRLTGAPTNRPLESRGAMYDVAPLTTVGRIERYLARAQNTHGTKLARQAVTHVADNSASPMESVLYLLLCLPRRLGGYALRRPILNAKRAVSTSAESFTMADYLVPDLYWPGSKLDIEYDSERFHSSPQCLRAGARRTLALRAMHVSVISMTYDILSDAKAFEGTARLAAKALKVRMRKSADKELVAREHLRDSLLHHKGLYRSFLFATQHDS